MIENKFKCAQVDTPEVSNYYLDDIENIFKKCPSSCQECNGENSCTSCSEPYYLVEGLNKCITLQQKYLIIFILVII